jgi:hypothetical protein
MLNKEYLYNKFLNFSQYRFLPAIQERLKSLRRKAFEDIGKRTLPANAPRALVINISTAIPYYIEGSVENCPILNNHALFWEAAELVRQLNVNGYLVDFIDCNDAEVFINWEKYDLVFDERNNLMYAPTIMGQKRIFYSTGLKWNFHNEQELKRTDWFFHRTGIRLYPQRFVFPNYSDEFADYQTFYGRSELVNMFSESSQKVSLDISCTYVPDAFYIKRRKLRRFVWFGGTGAIHKGLDLTVEAFRRMPQNELLIFGPAKREPVFFEWLNQIIRQCPNIKYCGYADLKNEKTTELLNSSIANIFPSCSEGGPGSVAQAAFFGLVPIVTDAANIRYEHLGYKIENGSDQRIINSIIENVENFHGLSEKQILEKMEAVYVYANQFHTREAYRKSLSIFLNKIL